MAYTLAPVPLPLLGMRNFRFQKYQCRPYQAALPCAKDPRIGCRAIRHDPAGLADCLPRMIVIALSWGIDVPGGAAIAVLGVSALLDRNESILSVWRETAFRQS